MEIVPHNKKKHSPFTYSIQGEYLIKQHVSNPERSEKLHISHTKRIAEYISSIDESLWSVRAAFNELYEKYNTLVEGLEKIAGD